MYVFACVYLYILPNSIWLGPFTVRLVELKCILRFIKGTHNKFSKVKRNKNELMLSKFDHRMINSKQQNEAEEYQWIDKA